MEKRYYKQGAISTKISIMVEKNKKPVVIKKMPSKKMLEGFMNGALGRGVTVVFNVDLGIFYKLPKEKQDEKI